MSLLSHRDAGNRKLNGCGRKRDSFEKPPESAKMAALARLLRQQTAHVGRLARQAPGICLPSSCLAVKPYLNDSLAASTQLLAQRFVTTPPVTGTTPSQPGTPQHHCLTSLPAELVTKSAQHEELEQLAIRITSMLPKYIQIAQVDPSTPDTHPC